MAFAEENTVVAELLCAPGAFVNLVDIFYAAVDAVQAEFHNEEGIRRVATAMQGRSMLRPAPLSLMKDDHAAAGRPGNDRLAGEQVRPPVLYRASESNPGSYFMPAGAGFRIDLVVRVGGQTGVVALDYVFQKVLVERNI